MTVSRRTALLTAAALAAGPLMAASLDRRALVHRLSSVIRREYQDESAANRMADQIDRRLAAGAYDAAPDQQGLAGLLNADLQGVVADKHMAIVWGMGGDGAPLALDPVYSLRQNYGVQVVRRLSGNVGLIELNFAPSVTLGDPLFDRYAGAMALVRDTRALVLDVRAHIGGEPEAVAYFVSYFFDREPFVVNRIRYRNIATVDHRTTAAPRGGRYGERRPLFVLVSADTFSGGEELAYDLQATRRAQVVGKTTGGGANPNKAFDLGQGFMAYVPNGAAVNPITGTNWEGVGVKPDLDAEPAGALRVAHGLALRAALTQAPSKGEADSISQAIASLPA